ncbi:DUF3857 domain-containing protein [Nonlabens mediterrranea]|uniref:DUF3857 domain-containing protein n=1 Tax=Nonlabens mediterrranea TaxID=1419947 RepID=A0ABS0AC05_9FLAO|nr:DUF3857 domain-containing protein [Nonlabens mediterrranea]
MRLPLFTISVLFMSFITQGQSKLEKELQEKFWSNTAAQIKAMDIPEKWNEESAVILKDHRYIQYINSGKVVYFKSNKHQLIKIQDQASLEGFSEISLSKDSKISFGWTTTSRKETTIGIRIIKSDGSISLVDIEKEEVEEDDKRKIAIPNLEIGDIIDIYIQTDRKERDYDGLDVYAAIETTIKDNYPILDYRIAVEVENDFFLNMNTYNGAPAVKEEETERSATKMYVVEAQNVDKLETSRWYYPLVEEPSVKLQVAFARKRSNEYAAEIFKGEDGERKASVDKTDVLDYFDRKFNRAYSYSAKEVIAYIKKGKFKSKAEKLQAGLEYIRFNKNTRFFEPIFAYQADIVAGTPRSKCYDLYFGIYEYDAQVVNDLRAISEEFNIDYDIVLVQPRYDGKLDDLLIKGNARVGLKFNTQPELYFFDFNENMTLERFPEQLEGAEAYIGSVVKKKNISSITRTTLNSSTASQNVYQEIIDLSLTDDKKGFEMDRELSATGHFESEYIFSWIHWTDFLEEDYETYKDQEHFYECGSKKELQRYAEQFTALEEKKVEEFRERREKAAKSEWEDAKVSDYSTEVIETGRYGDNSPLKVKETMTLKDGYIKKAGKNLIIEIGKFIGGQVELDEKERERSVDIYLDHAKTYVYEIKLEIPEGYTVKGLDALNSSVDNVTGNFITTAVMDGNMLKVKTIKTYKNNYLKSEQWNDMALWLDAAFAFNQAKVLLEKK